MHRLLLILTLALVPALLRAQQAGPLASRPRAVPFEHFHTGAGSFTSYSGIDDSLRTVVRDAEGWKRTWRAIHRRVSPVPPVPAIDFGREMVVVAALGARPTGGFSIRVDSVIDAGDALEVVIRKDIPGAGCFLSAALTQPLDLALLPARPLPVRFRDRTVAERCE